MPRSLGPNQVAVFETMDLLRRGRGSAWLRPADVVALLPGFRMDVRTHSLNLTLALARARTEAARESVSAARRAARLERAGVSSAWKGSAFTVNPGVRIPGRISRGHRKINPARIFAALESRGIVERQARSGPGSRVRLVQAVRSAAD